MNKLPLSQITKRFVQELQDAKAGKQTSLPFILHPLPKKPLVKEEEIFQVMVIGGSVFKNARVFKKNAAISILSLNEKPQPSFHTKDDLSSFLTPELDPQTNVIAVNFAYPMKPILEGDILDGILTQGSKENTFKGLLEKRIGHYIQTLYQDRFHKTIPVACANDTICLLLSGFSAYDRTTLAAGVVGTGTNFAMFLSDSLAINLESGNFSVFPRSDAAKAVDAQSIFPGRAWFEKETAGAYLYQHFNVLQDALTLSSTQELADLAADASSEPSPLARSLLKHSAALIACQIAGIALFQKRDMEFIMEGGFFWGSPLYRGYIEHFLKQLAPHFSIRLLRIKKSSTIGAARLVA